MSSSIPSAWRTRLPPFLTEPIRMYDSGAGDDAARAGQALAAFDALGRYLVALFFAANDGDIPGPVKELAGRLERPTLGLWWNAAAHLAKACATSREAGPVRDVARALLQAEVTDALARMIGLRNERAHSETGNPTPSPTEAREWLAQMRGPLRTILTATAPLGDVPLFCERRRTQTTDGVVLELVQFSGRDAASVSLPVERCELLSNTVFALEPSGRVLYLDPIVAVGEDTTSIFLLVSSGSPPKWTACNSGVGTPQLTVLGPTVLRTPRKVGRLPSSIAAKLTGPRSTNADPVVEGYDVLRLIGSGATASVWEARPHSAEPNVALKVLHPHVIGPASGERVRREVARGAALQSPYLVRILGQTETTDGRVVIVQELITGPSFTQLIAAPRYSRKNAIDWGIELAKALSALHREGLVHRDVKPDNLLLDAQHRLRLADLGLISALDDVRVTKTGADLGTLAWAAPEQLRGETASPASDVYAAGGVLQSLLGAIKAPRANGLLAVVRRATALDPADRYASGAELLAALEDSSLLEDVCPVAIGDRIGTTWRVARAGARLGQLHQDVWALEARSDSGLHVLLLTQSDAGRSTLTTSAKLVQRAVERTADGLHYFAIPPELLQVALGQVPPGHVPADGGIDPTTLAAGAAMGAVGVAGLAALAMAGLGAAAAAASASQQTKASARSAATTAATGSVLGPVGAGLLLAAKLFSKKRNVR